MPDDTEYPVRQSSRTHGDCAGPDDRAGTFSAFAKDDWVAAVLGRSQDWLKKRRDDLEQNYGFPSRDSAVRLYLKEDVLAWIDGRKKIREDGGHRQNDTGERLNEL